MNRKVMEVIALSLEDIVIAQEHGANRIELCSGLAEGALTPSYGFMEQARKQNTDRCHAQAPAWRFSL